MQYVKQPFISLLRTVVLLIIPYLFRMWPYSSKAEISSSRGYCSNKYGTCITKTITLIINEFAAIYSAFDYYTDNTKYRKDYMTLYCIHNIIIISCSLVPRPIPCSFSMLYTETCNIEKLWEWFGNEANIIALHIHSRHNNKTVFSKLGHREKDFRAKATSRPCHAYCACVSSQST